MRSALLLAVLLGTSALLASCSSDETGPEPPGPIPIDSLRSEAEAADCEFQVRCTHMPDAATCKAVDTADYELHQLIADVADGKVEYSEQAGRDWVEAVRGQPCQLAYSVVRALSDAYRAAFVGTVAAGGPCFVDPECAGGAVCDRTLCQDGPDCCAGTCVEPPAPVAIGGDCTTAACEESAYCDTSGTTAPGPVCVERAGNGQPCIDELSCQEGQLCGNGKCYKLSAEGGACNPNLPVSCLDYSNYCAPMESKCVKLPAAGEPCAATGAGCQLYAYCDGATCQRRPSEGEPCVDGGPQCLGDLRCDNDVCVPRSAVQVCVGDGNPPPPGTGGAGGGV